MRVMRVRWEKKRATAQEFTDELNKSKSTKFSTVSTFLQALVRKGAVGYDIDNRTYIYYPLIGEKVAQNVVNGLIDHIFIVSMEGFVSFIIKNKYISSDNLEKIKKLIDKEEM